MRRVGYQGMEGSNSLASARNMTAALGWDEVEYVPLITSRGVVDALKAGTVDYGVMAVNNHIAGPVRESEEALAGLEYRILAEDTIPISHCLFTKDASVTEIETVASHIQALKQCAGNLRRLYPSAGRQEVEDTAIAARYLAEGTLPPTAGVLCRRDAGEAFGLHLLRADLQDDPRNATDFILMTLGGD